jgi:hypothetical protein
MKRSNRLIWIGVLALVVVFILTFVAAPSSSKINTGSTYSRAPEGYGAWYAFMQQSGTPIKRWQKPFSDLKAEKPSVTLLQINSYLTQPSLFSEEVEWVEKGNTLIILGVRNDVTAAKFSTMQKSPFGIIKIDTRRRRVVQKGEKVVLGDKFGAVVWEKNYGKGKVIFSTTPYLAANAYQDYLSNFEYLKNLVTQEDNTLLVDEYIHGYKDSEVIHRENEGDLLSYFVKTPLFPVFLQVGVVLLVLIWGQNRRFGKPVALETPTVDNSEAYITALAGVLEKARSTDFVVEMIGKEEQLQLQKALGLGQELHEHQNLVNAWKEQKGSEAPDINEVLKLQSQKRRISEPDLLSWLKKWQSVHRHFSP